MKKLLVTLIALGFAGMASAQISTVGAPHNFYDNLCGDHTTMDFADTKYCGESDANGWNDSDQICKVCHVPHMVNSTAWAEGYLWNHAVTETATWNMYDSDTIDGVVSSSADFASSSSKLCLNCHDGTVAVDAFDTHIGDVSRTNTLAPANTAWMGSGARYDGFNGNIGTDMSQSHPVSITYDVAADGGLNPVSDAFGGATINDWLEAGRVQCATCHDVHGDRTNGYVLREPVTGSEICLACHDK